MNLHAQQKLTPLHYLAVRDDGLAFLDCVHSALKCPDLLREHDRLCGTNLARRGAPIDLAVDEATGRLDADCEKFLQFIWDNVFLRMPKLTTP